MDGQWWILAVIKCLATFHFLAESYPLAGSRSFYDIYSLHRRPLGYYTLQDGPGNCPGCNNNPFYRCNPRYQVCESTLPRQRSGRSWGSNRRRDYLRRQRTDRTIRVQYYEREPRGYSGWNNDDDDDDRGQGYNPGYVSRSNWESPLRNFNLGSRFGPSPFASGRSASYRQSRTIDPRIYYAGETIRSRARSGLYGNRPLFDLA